VSRPLCPNCIEKMSAAEAGLEGIWSCVHCEGVWLPVIDDQTGVRARLMSAATTTTLASTSSSRLLSCAVCAANDFRSIQIHSSVIHACVNGHGIFLSAEDLLLLAPRRVASGLTTTALTTFAAADIFLLLAAYAGAGH
jgi:hypothetical protein